LKISVGNGALSGRRLLPFVNALHHPWHQSEGFRVRFFILTIALLIEAVHKT